jgi:hypothetical protein
VIITQPRRSLKDHIYNLRYPVIEADTYDLNQIEVLLKALVIIECQMAVSTPDATILEEIKGLASLCMTFLFVPFATQREPQVF